MMEVMVTSAGKANLLPQMQNHLHIPSRNIYLHARLPKGEASVLNQLPLILVWSFLLSKALNPSLEVPGPQFKYLSFDKERIDLLLSLPR